MLPLIQKDMEEDKRLVGQLLARNERAFELFFDTYFPSLYRFACSRLNGDHTATEEVVQKALCKAVTKLSTYRGEASLFTWLCTFCRHEISAYLKTEGRFALNESIEFSAAIESLVMAEDRPDRKVLRSELQAILQLILNSLPPHYAEALEWKYIEGMSVKEIASRMSIGMKAAESLLGRARQAFRTAFVSAQSSGESG